MNDTRKKVNILLIEMADFLGAVDFLNCIFLMLYDL